MFATEVGGPVRPDYVSRHFTTLTTAAGLPRITLHQGRHTAATMALEAGLDIKVVAEQLGQSTPGSRRTSTSTCAARLPVTRPRR